MGLVSKIFGTHSEREIKRIRPIVDKIVSLRPQMVELTDEQLRGKTDEFKKRLADGETLDDFKLSNIRNYNNIEELIYECFFKSIRNAQPA